MMITAFFTITTELGNTPYDAINQLNSGLGFLVTFAMLMVIFGMITMEIVEQCYKLIYQLPNSIMQWIGAPQNQMAQDYGQMAQGVKGAVSSTATSGGQIMKGVDKANQGLVKLPGDVKKGMKEGEEESGTLSGEDKPTPPPTPPA